MQTEPLVGVAASHIAYLSKPALRLTTPFHLPVLLDMAAAISWGDSALSDQLESRELVAADKPAMKELCKECFPVEYPDVWYDGLVSGAEGMHTRGVFEKSTGLLVGMIASQIHPLHSVEREYGAILEKAHREDAVMYINIFGKKSVLSSANFCLRSDSNNSSLGEIVN